MKYGMVHDDNDGKIWLFTLIASSSKIFLDIQVFDGARAVTLKIQGLDCDLSSNSDSLVMAASTPEQRLLPNQELLLAVSACCPPRGRPPSNSPSPNLYVRLPEGQRKFES